MGVWAKKKTLREAGGQKKTLFFKNLSKGHIKIGVWPTGFKKSCHWALSGNVLTQGWNEAFLIGLGKELYDKDMGNGMAFAKNSKMEKWNRK